MEGLALDEEVEVLVLHHQAQAFENCCCLKFHNFGNFSSSNLRTSLTDLLNFSWC